METARDGRHNGSFEENRTKLDASLLALNKWFTGHGKWNEAAIEERSAELAERAIAIWPHPGGFTGV